MDTKIKRWILYFVFIILLLPVVEQEIDFIKSGELKGGFKPAVDSFFTIPSWLSGTFQHQKELFVNDATGFRADLVRMNNQIDYSLFDKCHAGWTIKGKNGYLFQYPYLNAYYGTDYVGYRQALGKSVKLKAIQDTLANLGKSLILVIAPSKASSYPEYFPDDRREPEVKTTNYQTYRHLADSLGIHNIDMDAWFVSMKNKSKEPIFSKQGIHFTNYGAILAGDSLIKYMEHLRNTTVQHPDWSQMEYTNKLRCGDDDVARELNLIFPVANETLAYPIIKNLPDSTKKFNCVYIGDSYGFKMVEFGIVYKMNNQCEFWSYFNEVHDINGHKFCYIHEYDWVSAMCKADCVVLVYTLFNFDQLGNGFIEQAYNHFYPAKS